MRPSAWTQKTPPMLKPMERAFLFHPCLDVLADVDSGTQAGDKIEIAAIANTFTDGKERPEPLVVGSVKTNIGHLEAAAGIAGLIKTVLALERGSIPPHLNFEKEREGMHLQARNIKVSFRIF